MAIELTMWYGNLIGLFISHTSKSTVSFSVTSVTSHMKSHESGFRNSSSPFYGIRYSMHSSHSVTSEKSQDHPSLDLSAHATVATCTLPAEHTCAIFYFYRPPLRRFAVNAIMWLPKPKPKTGFGLSQNRKTGFYRWNPVLETLDLKAIAYDYIDVGHNDR